jgi:hypothetical protein
VYDAHAHGATGSATGVSGENLGSLLNLGQSFTAVPGGTAHWTFAGTQNYAPASGDVSITITQATAAIRVSGYAGTYDGQAHGASGSATGVIGEDLSALLNLGASFVDVPGGAARWSFAGNANYRPASGSVVIMIVKATPVLSNLSSPTITVGAGTASLSGNIAAGALVPPGSVAITLNGVTQNAAIQPDGSFSASFNTAALVPASPAYTIQYSYAGGVDFNSANGTGMLTVGYHVVPLFERHEEPHHGATLPIRLILQDARDRDVSSRAITVDAVRVVQVGTNRVFAASAPGHSDPNDVFRFRHEDHGMYSFELSTRGLPSGRFNLIVKVAGDPEEHALPFELR